jgi:hypothetical protein
MNEQQILKHLPELIPYSPHLIVGKKIHAYATKSPFPKKFSHEIPLPQQTRLAVRTRRNRDCALSRRSNKRDLDYREKDP